MGALNLYHLYGTLRYGRVVGDNIEFAGCLIRGGRFLPITIKNTLLPIFKVQDGIYPTPEEWEGFLKTYPGR